MMPATLLPVSPAQAGRGARRDEAADETAALFGAALALATTAGGDTAEAGAAATGDPADEAPVCAEEGGPSTGDASGPPVLLPAPFAFPDAAAMVRVTDAAVDPDVEPGPSTDAAGVAAETATAVVAAVPEDSTSASASAYASASGPAGGALAAPAAGSAVTPSATTDTDAHPTARAVADPPGPSPAAPHPDGSPVNPPGARPLSMPPLAVSSAGPPPRATPEGEGAGLTQSAASTVAPAAAATPSAVTAPLPADAVAHGPVSPRAVAAQVSPVVVSIAQRPAGAHQLTMTVDPESLGPVTVRAHIGPRGDVQVELLGGTDAGRDALRAIAADLRRDLAAVLPNANLSIAPAAGAGAEPGDRGAAQGSPGDGRPAAHDETRHGRGTERRMAGAAPEPARILPVAAGGAGLDIFA